MKRPKTKEASRYVPGELILLDFDGVGAAEIKKCRPEGEQQLQIALSEKDPVFNYVLYRLKVRPGREFAWLKALRAKKFYVNRPTEFCLSRQKRRLMLRGH